MEGLQAFDDMMANTKVKYWYRRMESATLNHEGLNAEPYKHWTVKVPEGRQPEDDHRQVL